MAQSQEQINIALNIIDQFSTPLNKMRQKMAELSEKIAHYQKIGDKDQEKAARLARKAKQIESEKITALREEEQIKLRILKLEERRITLEQRQNRYNRQSIGNVLRGGSGGFFGAMGGYNFGGRGVGGLGRNLIGNALLMGGGRGGGMMGMGMMGGLSGAALAGLGGAALVGTGALAFQQEFFDTDKAKEIGMERERARRRLAISAPGGRAGARQLQGSMDELANKYGVSSAGLEEGFGKYYIASKKAGVTDETLMKRMETFTATFTALGLEQEEVKRVMKAFEQITDKNRVMSEELRHQLGDAGLAGIVQDVAKGLGITTKELDKRMKKGEITPDEFFMAITKEWNTLYLKIAQQNASSYEAQAERFNNKLRTHYDEYWEKTVMPFERKWLEFKMDFLDVAKMILDKLPASKYAEAERASEEKTSAQILQETRRDLANEANKGGLAGQMLGMGGNKRVTPATTAPKDVYEAWLKSHPDWSEEQGSMRYTEAFAKEMERLKAERKKRLGKSYSMFYNEKGLEDEAKRNLEPLAQEIEAKRRYHNERKREYDKINAAGGGGFKGAGGDDDKNKLKSDYHTPRIININILTGNNSSLVNGFTIENYPMQGDKIDMTLKGKIEEVLYDVITDASTSIARATK